GPIADIADESLATLVTQGGNDIVKLTPHHLAHGNGPEHAYYDVEWSKPAAPLVRPETVGMLLRGGDEHRGEMKYTAYQVTVKLSGKQITYGALALHHAASAGDGSKPEIIDRVTEGMNLVVADESPRVQSPWKTYVKSDLYLAVARSIRDLRRAGLPLIPADAPIGYLPGDDVQAEAGLSIKDACVLPTVDIYQGGPGGARITGQTQNCIVGQQINLTAVVQGSSSPITNTKWAVPGSTVGSYTVQYTPPSDPASPPAPTSASVTAATFTNAATTYYWVDGGDGRNVTFSCKAGGKTISATTTFNVAQPTAKFSSKTVGTISVDSACLNILALHYGCSLGVPGIKYTSSATIPAGFDGVTQLVQVVTSTTRTHSQSDGQPTAKGSNLLDTAFPYGSDEDAPEELFAGSDRSVSVNDSFTIWLIFQPKSDNSIWVPLMKLSWSWSASASPTHLFAPMNSPDQTGVSTTDFPLWSGNIRGLQYK
ncbi:MAG TPA: hypothetical protein VJX67_22615, partial [Blastocatellia bacterium]|nr:hypothetical protein [Blastocatellia bacterium]